MTKKGKISAGRQTVKERSRDPWPELRRRAGVTVKETARR